MTKFHGKNVDVSFFDEKTLNVERNSVIILVLTTSKTETSRLFAKKSRNNNEIVERHM